MWFAIVLDCLFASLCVAFRDALTELDLLGKRSTVCFAEEKLVALLQIARLVDLNSILVTYAKAD